MNISKLKASINERIRNCDELQDNWDYGIEQCRKQFIDVLSENIPETIDFVLNSCSDEELFWISEVFEDIAGQTQSIEFIEALRTRLKKVTRENYRQENFKSKFMRDSIDFDEFQRSVGDEIEYTEAQINR